MVHLPRFLYETLLMWVTGNTEDKGMTKHRVVPLGVSREFACTSPTVCSHRKFGDSLDKAQGLFVGANQE